jgi:MscS family membrane protein
MDSWFPFLKNMLPPWMSTSTLMLSNAQWVGLLLVITASYIIKQIFRFYLRKTCERLVLHYEVPEGSKIVAKFIPPTSLMLFAGLWLIFIRPLMLPASVLATCIRIGHITFTVTAVMATNQLVNLLASYFERMAKHSQNKFDDILVPLIKKSVKFFVISVGIIVIGDSLTINMKNVLAGLGIGGIAFALAAKDTLSNLFGSLTVLIDRPFEIGDWVTIGKDVEGVVEEVGLRSTRVRTFYHSLITVPNGQLTNVHIDNYGRRRYRRFTTHVGVEYSTPPEKIDEFCKAVRQIVLDHPHTRKDYFHVYFNKFNDSSLDILVYIFWEVPTWAKELEERHRFLIDVLKAGREVGVSFAFPTRTLHLANSDLPPEQLDQSAEAAFAGKMS